MCFQGGWYCSELSWSLLEDSGQHPAASLEAQQQVLDSRPGQEQGLSDGGDAFYRRPKHGQRAVALLNNLQFALLVQCPLSPLLLQSIMELGLSRNRVSC